MPDPRLQAGGADRGAPGHQAEGCYETPEAFKFTADSGPAAITDEGGYAAGTPPPPKSQ